MNAIPFNDFLTEHRTVEELGATVEKMKGMLRAQGVELQKVKARIDRQYLSTRGTRSARRQRRWLLAEAASNFRSRVYRLQSRDGRDHLLKFLICGPSRLSLAPLAVFSFHRIMGWCDLYWS